MACSAFAWWTIVCSKMYSRLAAMSIAACESLCSAGSDAWGGSPDGSDHIVLMKTLSDGCSP